MRGRREGVWKEPREKTTRRSTDRKLAGKKVVLKSEKVECLREKEGVESEGRQVLAGGVFCQECW